MSKRLVRLLVLPIALVAGIYTPASAQQLTPLRVSLGPISTNSLPFMIALEEGMYRRNGLDVQLFQPPGTVETAKQDGVTVNPQYISQGDSPPPIFSGNGVGLVVSRTTNADAPEGVSIATFEPMLGWHIVAQPEIARIEQLKGKRIGFSGVGALPHFAALVLAERMGWDRLKDVSLMANGQTVEDLKNRRVDAMAASGVRYVMAQAAGFKSILDTRSWNVPMPGTGVSVSRAWLRDNRDTARRFVKSLVEAIAAMKKNKEVAFQAMAKWWGITDPQQREMIYAAAAQIPSKPYPSVEGIKKVMQLYDSNEMRKYKPEDFYDNTLVRELDQSGFIDGLYR